MMWSPATGTSTLQFDRVGAVEAAHARPADTSDPGIYMTDGVFLHRVVGLVSGIAGDMIRLEDCYGLDVVAVPVAELGARRFRVVVPASLEG